MGTKHNMQTLEFKYRRQLHKRYEGFITLVGDADFIGYDVPLNHMCAFCGEVTSAKPMTLLSLKRIENKKMGTVLYEQNGLGRGCLVCRTTEQHAHELARYIQDLKKVHGDKFSLAYLPQRFERDTGKYKQTFRCNDCGRQHYQTPNTILDPNFKCSECVLVANRGERTRFYAERLNKLYGPNRISMRGRYHDKDAMIHECDRGHLWREKCVSMLNGAGCPTCKNTVEVKQIAPVAIRNRIYLVRTKREIKALPAMIAKIGGRHKHLHTSRNFPTPILFGKNPVAFFDTHTRTIADVMSEKSVKANMRRKIPRSIERAKELGLKYGIILVTAKKVEAKWDEKELRSKAKSSKGAKIKTVTEHNDGWDSPFD